MASSNPTTKSSLGASTQSQKVPYFPPPPTVQNLEEEKKKKSSRRVRIQFPSVKPKQRRSSLRHTVAYSNQSRRQRLQEVHLPAIKLSPRHWLLVSLLFLSFLVLILGFIFADCVALPHTDRKDNFVTEGDIANSVTVYARQSIQNDPKDGSGYEVPANTPNAAGSTATSSLPAGSIPANGTTTPAEYLANESKRLGFDSPKNLAILFFYTATLPVLTIIHTVAELVLLYCSKRRRYTQAPDEECEIEKASENNNDSDSVSGTKNRLSLASRPKLPWLVTFLPAISLTISALLALGWTTVNTIQYHCEIHPLSPSSSSHDQSICPIQLRGHFMHGIHELSIAKNVMGWVLVAVYIGYVGWCARVSGLVWRAGREERRERRWVEEMERERVKHLRLQVKGGRAEVVVVETDGRISGQPEEEKKVATVDVKEVL